MINTISVLCQSSHFISLIQLTQNGKEKKVALDVVILSAQSSVRTGPVPYWYSTPIDHQDIFSPSSWQDNNEMPELPAGPHVAETTRYTTQSSHEHRTDYKCVIDWFYLLFSIGKHTNNVPFSGQTFVEIVFICQLLAVTCLFSSSWSTTLHLTSLAITSQHCIPDFLFIRHKLCHQQSRTMGVKDSGVTCRICAVVCCLTSSVHYKILISSTDN